MEKLRILLYSAVVTAMVLMASCSSDHEADVRGMLQTVPGDASMVAVLDLKSMLEKAGCDVKGSEVKPGKELAKAVEDSGNAEFKESLTRLQQGGVEPSAAVFFMEGYGAYLTGFLSDTDKFKTYVGKESGETFRQEDGLDVCGNVAVAGDRFWVCVNSHNTINAKDVLHFNSLSEKQSILSNDIVAALQDPGHDIAGWGDIKGCLNSVGMDFSSRAAVTMAVEAMFVDAVELKWNVDFEKGKMLADINVLNPKGGIAKFNFPASGIDEATVSAIGGTADGVVALAASQEMVRKLKEETGGKGFSVIGFLAGIISCVDGTCAMSFSDKDNAVKGIVSTTGHGTADLSSLLAEYGMKTSKEDKLLRFSKGEVSGAMEVKGVAAGLKGALAGAVYAGNTEKISSSAISSVAVTLNPEKGGLEARVRITGKDPGKNIILSFLEYAGK